VLSPIQTTCPTHLILIYFITRIILGEEHRSFRFSICSFLHSLVASSLLDPNILLNTPSCNTLSQRFSLNVSYQVSNPSKQSKLHSRQSLWHVNRILKTQMRFFRKRDYKKYAYRRWLLG
jgi:hypothetical protein